MATGRSMKLTGQTGEYLVAAELCRRNLISTTFSGGVPGFDILATDEQLRTVPIQVKTKRNGSWQFNAQKFLKITISASGVQEVKGKKRLTYPNLVYVFVRLGGQKQDEFYICREKDVRNIIHRNYTEWLAKKGGRRPRTRESTHCSIYLHNVEKYKDKWDIISG